MYTEKHLYIKGTSFFSSNNVFLIEMFSYKEVFNFPMISPISL